jgi:uncharacterized protein
MKILAITDIHGALHNLKKIPEAIFKESDIVVLSGDITHFGYRDDAEKIVSYIETLNKNIIAVAGNCDHLEVEDYLLDKSYSINKLIIIKDELHFMGISGSLPCPGTTPNEYREEDLEIYLDCVKNDPLLDEPFILVSHQPPFGTINDMVSNNLHVGSPSLREFIEDKQPLACLTGHIHEGVGKDKIGETIIVNPGPLASGGYALLDIDEAGVHKAELKRI